MVSASSISDPIIQLIASLALAFVLYAASFPSVMDNLTAGTITVVFSSMIALMRPLKSLTNVTPSSSAVWRLVRRCLPSGQ